MRNILVDVLPTAIEIDGQTWPINSDFRTGLRIILAFEDPSLAMLEKQSILLELLYEKIPTDIKAAFEKGMRFMNGGKKSEDVDTDGSRVYSFQKDANFIMGAFQQTHQIDLETAELHWWRFLALFMDLGPDTTFSNIVSLRSRIKSGEATKEERRMALKLHDILDLPAMDIKTIEEREADRIFFEALEKGKKAKALKRGKNGKS